MILKKEEDTQEEIFRELPKQPKHLAGQKKYKRINYPPDEMADLIRLLQIRQIELKLQIKNLQDANEKARVSLETFQKIYECAPVGYFTLDKRGIILQVNHLGSYLLGVEPSQLIGHPIHIFIAPESRSNYFGFFNRLRQGSEKNSCIVELKGDTFPIRTIRLEGWPEWVMIGSGEELHLFVNALDITSQREIEIKIQEMEEQYRNILTYIRDVYFRFGRDGVLISASPSFRDFAGLDPNEKIAGRPLHRFFRYPEDARRMYEEMMRNGSIIECETEFVWSDGTSHPVSISAWITLDKSGEISGEGIIRDITERRKIEQTLAEVNRKVAILGEVIRHDISNQLTSLQGFLSVMRNTPTGTVTADYILKADNELTTITRQIEFIKIYQQTGLQPSEWQDLANVIKNLPPGRIPVQIDLEPVEVLADVMFAHVFSNIFDNVERHGQYAHEIRVLGYRTPDAYTIIVADDGIGMTHDEKEKIFERGYGRHTGLGLFLIREILGITGITIQETSRPGEGARFEIVIPKGKFRECMEKPQMENIVNSNDNITKSPET